MIEVVVPASKEQESSAHVTLVVDGDDIIIACDGYDGMTYVSREAIRELAVWILANVEAGNA